MKIYHQNNNSKNLIVFFMGWGFDHYPFLQLKNDSDILYVYDYNEPDLNFDPKDFTTYTKKYLLSWSMGVFSAYLHKNLFENFDKKIAINGTVFPIDNAFGIPEKIFELTLKHAQKGLEGKFYQNVFDSDELYSNFQKNPVKRSINNRVNELHKLKELIYNFQKDYENFYNKAYICENDAIIPPRNQIRFWQQYKTPIKKLEFGHFPYYQTKNLDYFIK